MFSKHIKILYFLYFLLVAVFIYSKYHETKAALSTQKLMQALRGEHFKVRLPQDLKDKGEINYVGLALRYAGGTIEQIGGGSSVKGGELIECFLFREPGTAKWQVCLMHPSGQSYPTIEIPEYVMSQSARDADSILTIDDYLIRFSPDGRMSASEVLGKDDFDLILNVYQL